MKTCKLPIRLCMGSSCYARGNDQILDIINTFLKENNLTEKVDFRGHLCQGNCNGGPNLSIGETKYPGVSPSSIGMILEDALKTSMV
jgi:NADH:ubiquinone oxidoreductase subunit E